MSNRNYYKDKIKKGEGLNFHIRNTSIPGTLVAEATFCDYCSPIGSVWFTWVGNRTISIAESYVPKQFRRCGIRTFIHNRLIASYPTLKEVITETSTAESRPWLIKQGFVRNKYKDWILKLD